MDQDVSKIESYSKVFAEKITSTFFSTQEAVTSENLLSITPTDQVNLFIAKNLFQKWKDEIQKLKSPYFNYENDQVKKGLSEFMNVLSRNIYVRKDSFRPLVEKAVLEALLLIFKPATYIQQEVSGKTFNISDIKDFSKYYKVHKNFWTSLIGKYESRNQAELRGEEIMGEFNSYISYSQLGEAERNTYIRNISLVVPFEIVNEAKPVISVKPAEPEVFIKPELSKEPEIRKEPEVRKEPDPVRVQEVPVKETVIQTAEAKILNEKFAANQVTINDLLTQNAGKTIADRIGKSRIENLRGAIPLNQKFFFISTLFGGAGADYENALNDIEKCSSYEEALHLLNNNYANRYKWDFKNSDVMEFVEIVERKFV